LSLHVDYWDHLGWKDVFSSKEFTDRQQAYARLFHLSSVYTPQAVVNGRREMVGSDKGALDKAISEEIARGTTNTLGLAAIAKGREIEVNYEISNNRDKLNIALVKKKSEIPVKRGENSGRKLTHINVVMALRTLDHPSSKGVVQLELPQGATPADYCIIAFAQDQQNLFVTAASRTEL